MKLTYEKVLVVWTALQEVSNQPVYATVALGLSRLRKGLRQELDLLEEERQKLLDKYAEKDEEGKRLPAEDTQNVKLADPDAFLKEWKDLLNMEVEFTFKPLSMDTLGNGLKIRTTDLDALLDAGLVCDEGQEQVVQAPSKTTKKKKAA